MNIKKTKGRTEIYEKVYILASKWTVNLKSEKRLKGSCNCYTGLPLCKETWPSALNKRKVTEDSSNL